MLLKWILLCAIFAACLLCGRLLNASRARRERTLGDILTAMRVLRLRMLNTCESVGVLLKKSEFYAFRLLGGDDVIDPWQSWQDCRAAFTARGGILDSLTEADIGILDGFFEQLGRSERPAQNLLFSDAISRLEAQHLDARQRYRDGLRLNTAIGALIGVGICILLI